MEELVFEYLKLLKIPVSKKSCQKLIQSHPDYPSLLSISDTFERFGIPHQAVRIPKEEMANLAFPFLLWLKGKKDNMRLLKSQTELDTINLAERESSHAVVLQAESIETVLNKEDQKQFSEEKIYKVCWAVLISSFLGLLILSIIQIFSLLYSLLLLTVLVGGAASYFLFTKSIGIKYKTVDAFCGRSKKINCEQLLFSDHAQLFGGITFTDAVISYFGFQLVMVAFLVPFAENMASFLVVLSILSGLALPVVFYSIYIQAVKTKIWCRLCLIVDGVLIVQSALFAIMLGFGVMRIEDIAILQFLISALLLMVTASSVILLKNKIEGANHSEKGEIRANRVKLSPEVFTHLLYQEKQIDTTSFERELLIGRKNVPIQILMAGSFGCSPCKEGFEKAVQIVKMYPQKVNLTVRFLHGSKNKSNSSISPGKIILRQQLLQYTTGRENEWEKTERLIKEWYSLMDVDSFMNRYSEGENGQEDAVQDIIDQQNEWFEKEGIAKTPTFFINGYELPKNYSVNDLMVLIPGLTDHFQHKKK